MKRKTFGALVAASLLASGILFAACSGKAPPLRSIASDASSEGFYNVKTPQQRVCENPNDEVTEAQLKAIRPMLATKGHRIWHYLWHLSRNSWHKLSDPQKKIFTDIHPKWAVPRLTGVPAGADPKDAKFDPEQNGAGEDFLFMHHQMLQMVSGALRRAKQPCIAPWDHIPDSTDPTDKLGKAWPVPPGSSPVKGPEAIKKLKAWENKMKSTAWLKGRSLSSVGYIVEHSIHDNMHMRWAAETPPIGDRPDLGTWGDLNNLLVQTWPFDKPAYDWLADTYSAHVNRHFWKLHGLVESMIHYWLDANNYVSIAEDCKGAKDCYTWKGKWTGFVPSNEDGIKLPPLVKGPIGAPNPVLDTLAGLDQSDSLMNRGELTGERLKSMDGQADDSFDDPEKFVREIVQPAGAVAPEGAPQGKVMMHESKQSRRLRVKAKP